MDQHSTSRTPAAATLLAGALAGLLGVATAAGCGGSDDPAAASSGVASGGTTSAGAAGQAAAGKAGTGGGGAAGASQGGAAGAAGSDSWEKVVSKDTPISYQEFLAKCDGWGGLVQTTASCAGNNACKGYSYLDGTLTEHSCKGMNGCGPGMSCVVLDADKGRSGKELYEVDDGCATTCHAEFKEDGVNTNHFTLYVRPGTTSLDDAKKRFATGNKRRLASIIAFGVVGVNDDGIAYANMPPAHLTYSVAEIDRVIDYIRTLPIETKYYTITGAPDGAGGAAGAAGAAGSAGAAAGAGGTSGAAGAGGASGGAAGAAGAGGASGGAAGAGGAAAGAAGAGG